MKKEKEIKVTYVYDKNSSAEDQKKVDEAFGILFDIVYKKYWVKRKK